MFYIKNKILILCFLLFLPLPSSMTVDTEIVQRWADRLGKEIWKLGLGMTNADDIMKQYTSMNVHIVSKDGNSILKSALKSVSTMLARKIDAVKCIYYAAEMETRNITYDILGDQNATYCSSKYSPTYSEDTDEDVFHNDERDLPPSVIDNKDLYRNLTLHEDSHFFMLNVSTDNSCVHVPTNIYDKEQEAQVAIQLSESLDKIFVQNYKSDPSLVWQYFGSSTGVMRLYPGMPWNKTEADTYDCRVQSWYIEAATCSKDMIILFDVSGSMTGSKNYVARNTLKTILETLSNNDYINVYYFKNETREVVECFDDLVQATPENLKTLRESLDPLEDGKTFKIPLEGNANITKSFIQAFNKLREYREKRNCSHGPQGCNQMIMLITDYVPINLTDVFDMYNREYMDGNETFIPVRVFTYLIGKDVTNLAETTLTACYNRGYFVHIKSIEAVQQEVLKYINVIARPMILQGDEPPPTWTHAYIDKTRTRLWIPHSGDVDKDDSDKLVTSVAIPVFDRYIKTNNNSENITAKLLGVAGTDVPIDSISKLTVPYELGVNGYSFIVSNNGYLLLHPGLVTSINGEMQVNYNSIDIVEVEQIDDNTTSPRQLGEEIKRLRDEMVKGEIGSLADVPVLYHYDNMRRIVRVKQNYFYAPLNGTPFSIGISIPYGYGTTSIDVDDLMEIKHGDKLGYITQYFNSSFRVHPDWVYCKHHYLENHETENPEEELWKFLIEMGKDDWTWNEQYNSSKEEDREFSFDERCGRQGLNAEAYYCVYGLVKLLVFDAKLTDPFFREWKATREEIQLAKEYNSTLRFIATMSGLTRWHYVFDEDKNEHTVNGERKKNFKGKVFGDKYPRAIEESWYKAAVFQHGISKDSFSISVPIRSRDEVLYKSEDSDNIEDDITVTASLALFPSDGGNESPASVVGFQFSYDRLYERFTQISIKNDLGADDTLVTSCGTSGNICYLIDSSGYMVASEKKSDVGGFIGVREPYVLDEMLERGLFEKLVVYDYQAICTELQQSGNSSCSRVQNPILQLGSVFKWFIWKTMAYLTIWNFDWVTGELDYDYFNPVYNQNSSVTEKKVETLSESNSTNEKKEGNSKFSCDKEVQLFIMSQKFLANYSGINGGGDECVPFWWASPVPHTNLMLLVIDRHKFKCRKPIMKWDTEKKATLQSTQEIAPCHKLEELGGLPRRRLAGCFTYDPQEKFVRDCGKGGRVQPRLEISLLSLFVIKFYKSLL